MSQRRADILIANDEDDIARIVADRLEYAGYAVRRARDGGECLAQVKEQVPDLLLLDLRMPVLSGEEVLRHVCDWHGDLTVIIVSASADRQLVNACLKRGAADYLIKPFDGETLLKKVRAALGDNS